MKLIKQNTVCFKERLGRFKGKLNSGLHFYIPLVETIVGPVKLCEQNKDFNHQKVITKDNVEIDVGGVFFYRVNDPEKALYSVENYHRALDDLSMSISRAEIGKTTLDQIIQQRKDLNERIKENMNESTAAWGIDCMSYEVLKIELPFEIKQSLRNVAEAERRKREKVKMSEADKEFQIAVSEAEKSMKIIVEGGRADGVKLKAEMFIEGVKELNDKLKGGSGEEQMIDFLLLENYIKRYGEMLKKSDTMVLPEGVDGKVDGGLVSLAYIMNLTGKEQSDKSSLSEILNKVNEGEKGQNESNKNTGSSKRNKHDYDNESHEYYTQDNQDAHEDFFEQIEESNHRK